MRKEDVTHEYLKKHIREYVNKGDDISDETFKKIFEEIKHSRLIVAGNLSGDDISIATVKTPKGRVGLLFTDMDEYRKVFPDFEVEAHVHLFSVYKAFIEISEMAGYFINVAGEPFVLPREIIEMFEEIPVPDHCDDVAYTSKELKQLKDSIDNCELEEFIKNPQNAYDYEELFERISSSTLLTLMVCKNDLADIEENGVIRLDETHPQGSLFIEENCGIYTTVYTSEEKISDVDLPLNKFSQIIDFSYMVNFTLNSDFDGIIINPRSDNIILSRDMLLDYSPIVEMLCFDARLNTTTLYMFPVEA